MDIADCYRLLELSSGASFAEIKESYRRLARQYHPDINPDDQRAKDKFIALTEAYKLLTSMVQPPEKEESSKSQQVKRQDTGAARRQQGATKVTRKEESTQKTPELSEIEQQMKWSSYYQLQQLLKYQRFPRAIALVESLAQRLPQDPEVRQWQANVYQRWGRQLVNEKQLDKARIYLKKALKIDPHNRSLWSEVERDFRRIEQIF
jgi:tetratricopeptide (TPR) repeat protein